MERIKSKLAEFKYDSEPYIVALNKFVKQIQSKESENIDFSKEHLSDLNTQYGEKINECIQINESINKVQSENVEIQMEVETLKKDQSQLSCCNSDLKEALKNICKATMVQNNKQFRAFANQIQAHLGFKLKLAPSQDAANHWIATFLFGTNESENNHYIVISYDKENESFMLCNIKPKPNRFLEMVKFLETTNDLNGLLFTCWKFFSDETKRQ